MSRHSIWFCDGNYATAGSELLLTVWRAFPYGAQTIKYTVEGGTAVEGTDFDGSLDPLKGELSFADEENKKAIRIKTLTGGASGNRTVSLRIRNPSAGKIRNPACTSVIQDGQIFYFAAAAAGTGDGSSEANAAAFTQPAFDSQIRVQQDGKSTLLKRGDTFPIATAIQMRAIHGGNVNNPMIIGAWGTGAKPIIDDASGATFDIRGSSGTGYEHAYIYQDLNPVTSVSPASVPRAFRITNGGETPPSNITMQHMFYEHDGGGGQWGYLASIAAGQNHKFQFNSVKKFHEVAVFGDTQAEDTQIIANEIIEGGTNNSLDWGIYCAASRSYTCVGNFIKNSIQGIKVRGSDNALISLNHVAPRTNGTSEPRVAITYGGGKDNKVINGLICENNAIIGAAVLIGEQSAGGDPADYQVIFNAVHRNNHHVIDETYYSPTNALLVVTHPQQIADLDIINNTFHVINKDFGCVRMSSPQLWQAGVNCRIFNNLMLREGSGQALPLADLSPEFIANCTIDWNGYDDKGGGTKIAVDGTNYATVAAFNAAQGQEANGSDITVSLSAPDQFPYALIPSTFTAGQSGLVSSDFRNLFRAQPPTIGAWELNNGAVTGKFCG